MTGVLKVKVDGVWVPVEEPPVETVSPGPGVPTGGTVGQVLAKIDSAPYNTHWVTVTSGGGAPTGTAGGALSGTYPNPGLASAIAGAGIGISGNVLSITAGTGITVGADTVAITTNGVTNTHLATMLANRIKGVGSTAGDPADLLPSEARAVLASDAGASPTTKYLRGDGSWSIPPDTDTDTNTLGPDGNKGDITVGGAGTTLAINNDAVTYAKIQNVTATDKILGRSTAGSGDIEEITCTATARSLLDDTSISAMRTTLSIFNIVLNTTPVTSTAPTITVGPTQPTTGMVLYDLWVDTT